MDISHETHVEDTLGYQSLTDDTHDCVAECGAGIAAMLRSGVPTRPVDIHMDTQSAAAYLVSKDVPLDTYESGVAQLITSGYDINSNNADLLWHAIDQGNVNKVACLLKNGAEINHETGLYTNASGVSMLHPRSHTRASTPVYHSREIAALLLEHIYTSSPSDSKVITASIRKNPVCLNTFNELLIDSLCHCRLAILYAAVQVLPSGIDIPVHVLEMCHSAGYTPSGMIGDLVTELASRATHAEELEHTIYHTREKLRKERKHRNVVEAVLKTTGESLCKVRSERDDLKSELQYMFDLSDDTQTYVHEKLYRTKRKLDQAMSLLRRFGIET